MSIHWGHWCVVQFRNRAKVWEAEQEHYDTEKRKAEAKVSTSIFLNHKATCSHALAVSAHAAVAGAVAPISSSGDPLLKVLEGGAPVFAASTRTLMVVLPLLQAEFDREQEYLKTVSLLSEEEQRKYKERQVGQWGSRGFGRGSGWRGGCCWWVPGPYQ